MDWGALFKVLVPVAVSLAETIHARGENAKKLQTATSLVQTGLLIAAGAGAIPASIATDGTKIVQAINDHVADQNANADGVQPIGK